MTFRLQSTNSRYTRSIERVKPAKYVQADRLVAGRFSPPDVLVAHQSATMEGVLDAAEDGAPTMEQEGQVGRAKDIGLGRVLGLVSIVPGMS